MNNPIENTELSRFYETLIQEIKLEQVSAEEGGNLEQLFTDWATGLLSDRGDAEDKPRIAYDEKFLGTKKQHKVNAYFISDSNLTIELYITIYKGAEEPGRVTKDEIETAVKRITNFFSKGIYNEDYVNEIEESSEIFGLAYTLSKSEDLRTNLERVNVIILTDGIYQGDTPTNINISGYPVFYRVVDLVYLYNITEKSHIPIEIDFRSDGFNVPCIISPSENDQYQSYLAIIPGKALANIYERFGSRLLEQNIRSFLQFTGKINNGIRKTIMNEPHMFLAFNNGIAATAEELEIDKSADGQGFIISKVKDFQIVNGGQTTASIYHTFKKDKSDISGIFVQLKLSVVKNRSNFSEIVSRISEYANTQNKVSVSDLSSNRPYHIEMEKLSRSIVTPNVSGQATQTKWFYERARGQYKNERVKQGFTKSKQKAFDFKNPKYQVFTKEDLAKYVNAYQEILDGKKVVIGPHIVVRGNQKNYVHFINYNLVKAPDSIYYEDIISKTILFRAAERTYGIKPNSIGDMRYITVPYSISYLTFITKGKLDLYKIWKNQCISDQFKTLLYEVMVKIELFIKDMAPGDLYGEWAKKEECWNELKKQDFDLDFMPIKNDFEDPKIPSYRRRLTDEEAAESKIKEEIDRIKSVPQKIWYKIEDWGRVTEFLTQQQQDVSYNLAGRVKSDIKVSDYERQTGNKILDIVIEKAPELFDEIDELNEHVVHDLERAEITIEVIKRIIEWDRKNKRLKAFEVTFMNDIVEGKKTLTDRNIFIARLNLNKVRKFGFIEF